MRAAANEYRAKALECLSLAECMNDPERRAELLRHARLWMQLAEPVGTSRSAYEVEPAITPLSVVAQHNTWQQILRHKG
jgi:pyrroloquinoline quinone (PQQ) biosynthesis protein C